jgi:ubiquinone/menaquinone biosynthesis C-methylase UbiE
MSERKDFEQYSLEALKDVGLKRGHTVLDCCCGCGHYTIPASKLVGEEGMVYAIDADRGKLQDLKQKISSGLGKNVKIIQEDVEKKISLPNHSVDVILLYDIFWYFRPNEINLSRLLLEIHRIAKPQGGLISVFPTHIDSSQLQDFENEMKRIGFCLVNRLQRYLVHEKNIERGELLNFQISDKTTHKILNTNKH